MRWVGVVFVRLQAGVTVVASVVTKIQQSHAESLAQLSSLLSDRIALARASKI